MEGVVEDIDKKRAELSQSPFLAASGRTLKTYTTSSPEIRFLAVGNFDEPWPAYQTAVALWLAEVLKAKKITAWDPNFKKKDVRVLQELGIQVKEKDPQNVQDVVFFVPHAPYFLEPQLLKRVKNCVYIGNDLTMKDDSTMRDHRELDWYVEKARITPLKVKPKDPWREAFKNTAFHQLEPEN